MELDLNSSLIGGGMSRMSRNDSMSHELRHVCVVKITEEEAPGAFVLAWRMVQGGV